MAKKIGLTGKRQCGISKIEKESFKECFVDENSLSG